LADHSTKAIPSRHGIMLFHRWQQDWEPSRACPIRPAPAARWRKPWCQRRRGRRTGEPAVIETPASAKQYQKIDTNLSNKFNLSFRSYPHCLRGTDQAILSFALPYLHSELELIFSLDPKR